MSANSLKDYEQRRRELDKEIEELRKKYREPFENELKAAFAKHPVIKSMSWTQYTPYFCDGDPCVFSVNRDYLYFTPADEDEDEGIEYEDDEISEFDFREGERFHDDAEMKAAFEEISSIINIPSDDDLEAWYGDHVKVVVSASGVEINGHEHD